MGLPETAHQTAPVPFKAGALPPLQCDPVVGIHPQERAEATQLLETLAVLPHFRLPPVRNLWRNATQDLLGTGLAPELLSAYLFLPEAILLVGPKVWLRHRPDGPSAVRLLRQRLREWRKMSPPVEEGLWVALCTSYRFASPEELGAKLPARVRAWWWLAASREGSSLQGELDAFVSEAVPLVTRIPSVEEQFAVLKLFHGLG